MILIASSSKDLASVNIAEKIMEHYSFNETLEKIHGNKVYEADVGDKKVRLVTLNVELVYTQEIIESIPDIEAVIFVSRHSSISGIPTLSVHVPGNLGKAELGGKPEKVSIAPALAMKAALKTMENLVRDRDLVYEVSYECTHHGPSLDVPAMFAELGSSPENWKDQEAAEIVAHAVMKAVLNFEGEHNRVALGIGGPHYNFKFTRKALEENVAFGHIIPKYAFPLDQGTLRHCIERTLETVELAVLDWKGIKGAYKQQILETVEKMGLELVKV
ncbi:D-tyrosyl-tRNA(Tyr) deacylase [Candidatus Bathyarchaeota archaeon]|nr:D-tyrosyl-tRNA(Tyr) deacylase [Candidatus Bathyarchaeota archaeon]